ncbi:hypothetical protein WS46_32545 [Burkholderia sp. RF4-BP95]|nr:hypothetical protein WS46_32545 [Burkholderia sp. RF4-BP95]
MKYQGVGFLQKLNVLCDYGWQSIGAPMMTLLLHRIKFLSALQRRIMPGRFTWFEILCVEIKDGGVMSLNTPCLSGEFSQVRIKRPLLRVSQYNERMHAASLCTSCHCNGTIPAI